MQRLLVRENVPETHSTETAAAISKAVKQLRPVLRPRLSQLKESGRTLTPRNLVGTVPLDDGSVLEIEPKVASETPWAESVVQLLTDTSRIAVTSSQRSSLAPQRNDLSSALAIEYARRLEKALAQDGPLQVYEHHQLTSRRLYGHLNVGKWVRGAILDPTLFPIERDELTVANDFTRALSIVAGYLRRSAVDPNLRSRLRRLETLIIPGTAAPTYVNPAVAQRPLPAQWAKYKPAWDIAAAVLKNRSIIGDPGRSVGLEVAIEPWPLLETLLTKTLDALTHIPELDLHLDPKTSHPLLTTKKATATRVVPDGALRRGGSVVATFEAKYARQRRHPAEAHVYQALSAAAALQSPLAILIYPGDSKPKSYSVTGFNGTPLTLVTVGLSLYSYTRGASDQDRAQKILGIINA